MCVYVKDTSRSTETGSVCVCERHELIYRDSVCVYVKDTSRSTETGCVCLCERHE